MTSVADWTLGEQDDFLVVAGDPSAPAAGKVSVIHILDCGGELGVANRQFILHIYA